MISKSKNLIALFTSLFVLLIGIQGYFLYKTYQVKEREIYRDVHKRLTDYTDHLEDKGGMRKVSDDYIQGILIKLKNKEISQSEFLDLFDKNRMATQKDFSQYVDNQFAKEGYEVAVKIEYSTIIFNPTKTNLIKKPITLYETEKKVKKAGIINTGSWETTSSSTDIKKKLNRNNSFSLKSITGYEILNIKSVVFKELTLLILCCIALLASVLILYIFTIKNLIKQQKQIEVLHTIVDNISHEFKTPIATLKIASKTLKRNLNHETTLPLIERQIVRLESLLQQLHTEENTNEKNHIKPEDWNFFIQDLSFTYPGNTFRLQSNTAKELPFDKILMETIIKNLCENSVKYGASEIDINITDLEKNLEIMVTDNGDGIPKSEMKNIFEKFYRIQANNIHNTKGLGLGLYFVHNIITKYQGKIDVTSTLKKRTTFKINLPYEN